MTRYNGSSFLLGSLPGMNKFSSPKVLECLVCKSQEIEILPRQRILQDYSTCLNRCGACFFEWFENSDAWLGKAYANAIADTDTGIVMRNLSMHRALASFFYFSSNRGRILDWGSGSGLLIRLLRDHGFDCVGFEPYADPLLASGFTCRSKRELVRFAPFRAIVAIEVAEHLQDPSAYFEEILGLADTVIFSTEPVEKNTQGDDWWYYSRETGQHISFYSRTSLALLAQRFGATYVRSGNDGLHMMTRIRRDALFFRLIAGNLFFYVGYAFLRALAGFAGKRSSLTSRDHLAAREALSLGLQKSDNA